MHTIIYEISCDEIEKIIQETKDALINQKIIQRSNTPLADCVDTFLHRTGLKAWTAANVTGPYQILIADTDIVNFCYISDNKPWWKNSSPSTTNWTIPVLFRFADNSDALLFKMTFLS